jgi:hypothetical protein
MSDYVIDASEDEPSPVMYNGDEVEVDDESVTYENGFNCASSMCESSVKSLYRDTERNWKKGGLFESSSIKPNKNLCRIFRKLDHKTTIINKYGIQERITVKRRTPLELYLTSSHPGCVIRNAVSGALENGMHVGSRDENLYFRACISTGELPRNSSSNRAFFSCPDEYESMFQEVLSSNIKEAWRASRDIELVSRQIIDSVQ